MSDNVDPREWLVFRLAGQRYGIPIQYVRELTTRKGQCLRQVPGTPKCVLGVMRLRDRVLTIADLRTLMQIPSLDDETEVFVQTLDERERDHVKWLTELRACVDEQREFTLATDPHKCGFGKWYDALRADADALEAFTNRDMSLNRLIHDFDQPHQRIHAIAQQVIEHVTRGCEDDARKIIEHTQNTELAEMKRLFASAREMVRELRHPLIAILEREGVTIGVTVDEFEGVLDLDADNVQPPPGRQSAGELVIGFGQPDDESELISLINVDVVFEQLGCTSAAELPEPVGA